MRIPRHIFRVINGLPQQQQPSRVRGQTIIYISQTPNFIRRNKPGTRALDCFPPPVRSGPAKCWPFGTPVHFVFAVIRFTARARARCELHCTGAQTSAILHNNFHPSRRRRRRQQGDACLDRGRPARTGLPGVCLCTCLCTSSSSCFWGEANMRQASR